MGHSGGGPQHVHERRRRERRQQARWGRDNGIAGGVAEATEARRPRLLAGHGHRRWTVRRRVDGALLREALVEIGEIFRRILQR